MSPSKEEKDEEDEDLGRARDLLELHHGLKMKYVNKQAGGGGAGAGAGAGGIGVGIGGDEDKLRQARKDVEGVLARLKNDGGG